MPFLQVKALGLGRPREFLSKAIEPPSEVSIGSSLETLRRLRALDEEDDDALTPLGYVVIDVL